MDLVVFALGVKASSVRVLFYYHQWLGENMMIPHCAVCLLFFWNKGLFLAAVSSVLSIY